MCWTIRELKACWWNIADGGSKGCVPGKIVCMYLWQCLKRQCLISYLEVKHGLFDGLKWIDVAKLELTHKGRSKAHSRTSPKFFEHFHAPGNPGRERRMTPILHIQSAREKVFRTWQFFDSTANVIFSPNPVLRKSRRSRTMLALWMGWAFVEVRFLKANATGLEVFYTRRYSVLSPNPRTILH